MWYKTSPAGSLDQSQSTRVTDRRTDRITTPDTALAQLRRAVKSDDLPDAENYRAIMIPNVITRVLEFVLYNI